MSSYAFEADSTSGSNVATNVSSTTGLAAGQEIVASGYPPVTRILSVGVGTITLTNNAYLTATTVPFIASDVVIIDSLQTAFENVVLQIANITKYPKPSYSLDGQSISWQDYFAHLTRMMAALREQINIENGPFSFETQART